MSAEDLAARRTNPLCVKRLRRSFWRRVRWPSGAVASPADVGPGPCPRPSVAVASPHLQVAGPGFAAGAPPGPAASPAADWQRPGNALYCPGCGRSVVARPGSGLSEESVLGVEAGRAG